MAVDLQSIELSHKILIDALDKLDAQVLDWQATSSTKTIGETLLHIAAFEYLLATAASYAKSRNVDVGLWNKLNGGFAREAGFPKPAGFAADDYRQMLYTVRSITAGLPNSGRNEKVSEAALKQVIDHLRSNDPAPHGDYDKLMGAMLRSMMVHASTDGTMLEAMKSHEAYHRGQIFLQKHLRTSKR